MAGLWHDLLEAVDQKIANALRRIGVTGNTIDAGGLGGALPPAVLPPLAGDVTGPPGANTVVKVQGVAVSATDPLPGQVLTASSPTAAGWVAPADLPSSAQGTWLVSGGQVAWVEDYDYLVSAGSGYIDGILISWAEQSITLDAADPTDDRIDVIGIDNTATVFKATGDASANPSEPVVDPATQLKLALVTVEGGTTEPSGTTTELIYAENVGAPTEWDLTTSGSGWNVNSTNNPRTGTKDVEGTTVAQNAYFEAAIGSGSVSVDDFNQLEQYLRFKAAWGNNRFLQVTLRNAAGVQLGNALRISTGFWGLDQTNTTTYQGIVIPIPNFAAPAGSLISRVRYQAIGAGGAAIGCYIDDISLRAGGVTNVGGGITQDQADARYARRSLNGSDFTDPATVRTNLAITHANLPDVDTDDSPTAIHHTLGVTSDQAAAGDHTHGAGTHDHGSPSLPNPPAAQGGLYGLLADPDGPVFVENTTSHDGFPGLTQMSDGRLIIVYRQGTTHASDKGVIRRRISNNLGRTWSAATTIYTDATFDVRDPSITRLRGGRLLLTFQKYDHTGGGAQVDGGFTSYSDDLGVTWSTPVAVNSSLTDGAYTAYGPAITLPDGSLRLCGYGQNSGDSFDSARIFTSTDEGATWGGEVTIANGQADSRHYSEPHIARLLDGTLYVHMRSDTALQIWAATSTDDGATWSATASKFAGTGNPELTRICDGTLLCIYRKVTALDCVYRISTDDGATWGSEQTIEAAGAGEQMVYASSYELDDAGGVIAIAYAMERSGTTDADLRFQYLYRGNTLSPLSGDYLGFTPSLALDDLTDVVLTAPSAGQVLTYDGADWVNDDAEAGSITLGQLHEHVIGEDLTAETDSAKVTFVTANEFEPETLAAYLNGARLRPTTDYTEDAGFQSITFAVAPTTADELILDYVAA